MMKQIPKERQHLVSLGDPCLKEESAALYVSPWVTAAGQEGGGSSSEHVFTGAQVKTSLCLWVSHRTKDDSWHLSSTGKRTSQDTSKLCHRHHPRTQF